MVAIAATATLALALAACSSNEGTPTAESSPAASDTTDGDIDGSTNTDLEAAIDAVGPAGLTEIIADQIKAKGSVDEATKTITFAFDMSEDFSKVLIACQVAQGLYNEPDWEAYDVNIAFTDSTVNCQETLGGGSEDDDSSFFEEDVDYTDEGDSDDYAEEEFEPISSTTLPTDLPEHVYVPDGTIVDAVTLAPGAHWTITYQDVSETEAQALVEAYQSDSYWTTANEMPTENGGGIWSFSGDGFYAGLVIVPTGGAAGLGVAVTIEAQ